MALNKVLRTVYALLGTLYVVIGCGSMLLPTGWLPDGIAGDFLNGEKATAFGDHLLQEFGTVVLALGFLFLWFAGRKEHSRTFHWAVTFYFALDALIHWIGPDGFIGIWSRGIVNSIPFAVMLLLGLLEMRTDPRKALPIGAEVKQ